jgi:hypothetical protein
MQRSQERRTPELQALADEGITDYDDNRLGCEAMIGDLNSGFSYVPMKTHANAIRTVAV